MTQCQNVFRVRSSKCAEYFFPAFSHLTAFMRTREGGHKEEEEEEEEEEEGASDRKPAARLSSLLLGPCMPCGNSQSPLLLPPPPFYLV